MLVHAVYYCVIRIASSSRLSFATSEHSLVPSDPGVENNPGA